MAITEEKKFKIVRVQVIVTTEEGNITKDTVLMDESNAAGFGDDFSCSWDRPLVRKFDPETGARLGFQQDGPIVRQLRLLCRETEGKFIPDPPRAPCTVEG